MAMQAGFSLYFVSNLMKCTVAVFYIVFDFVLNNIDDNNNMRIYLIHYLNIYIFLNVTIIVIVIMIVIMTTLVIVIAIITVIMITLIFVLVITPLCSTPQHLVVWCNVII